MFRPLPTGPSNVIPLLNSLRESRGCDPLELASALRRVHVAGLRRGFLLLAPTRWAGRDIGWWIAACHVIRERTRLWVALAEAPDAEPRVWARDGLPDRTRIIRGLARAERAGVIELSRGVLSDDRGILSAAESMGVPAFDRPRIDSAIRNGTLGDLLERPITETLPASA